MQNVLEKLSKNKIKKLLLGYNLTDGLLFKIAIYVLLISIGFIYIYPMLYMLSISMQSYTDIINPSISWIPSGWYPEGGSCSCCRRRPRSERNRPWRWRTPRGIQAARRLPPVRT